MSTNRQDPSAKAVSLAEYRQMENRVICILKQGWPAKEITQWVAISTVPARSADGRSVYWTTWLVCQAQFFDA